MKTLAVNTATAKTSIALLNNTGLISERLYHDNRQQAQNLVPEILLLLRVANQTLQDVDRLVVVTGPGSFTGIRIGLATMIGFSIGRELPIIGVNSFEAYYQAFKNSETAAQETDTILVAIESLRAELYLQQYKANGNLLGEAYNLKVEPYLSKELGDQKPAFVIGDAAHKFNEHLPRATCYQIHDEEQSNTIAYHAGCYSFSVAEKNHSKTPEPFYIRPADAIKATNTRITANI